MAGANEKLAEMFSEVQLPAFIKNISIKKTSAMKIVGVISVAYISSVIVSSVLASAIMQNMLNKKIGKKEIQTTTELQKVSGPNYVTIKREIMGRNIFNSAGEFPDESQPETEAETLEKKIFDPHAKCSKSRLSLSLLGTIFIGNSEDSLATIRETGYSESDIYRVGDVIVGNEDAMIVAIGPKKVVINNNGNKECIEVDEKNVLPESNTYVDPNFAEHDDKPEKPEGEGGDSGCVILEGSYVEKELGDGFATIVNAARLVPNMEDNKFSGFKIFAINNSSLLGKVKLKNGDVITQVNDTSLKQPEQGFALYEAFQDEREINIHVLRGGKTPKQLCVKIK